MLTLVAGACLVSSGVTWLIARRCDRQGAPSTAAPRPSNVTAAGFSCAECGKSVRVGKLAASYVMTCGCEVVPHPWIIRPNK